LNLRISGAVPDALDPTPTAPESRDALDPTPTAPEIDRYNIRRELQSFHTTYVNIYLVI